MKDNELTATTESAPIKALSDRQDPAAGEPVDGEGATGAGTEDGATTTGADTSAPQGLSALQVVGSMLAAGLGVQSSKNRERDFKQGRAGVFIAAGLVFTALFIGAVYTVVALVLSTR